MNHKDMLARLLAEENIGVIRDAVKTASFDISGRILRLPVWADISEDVEDLLISHEVAHAKYTDPDYFLRADLTGLKFTVMNILEDNRIERLIRKEYPAFRAIYTRAYNQLFEDGFFGDNYDSNLLDRINTYSKVGTQSGITFSPEEEKLFDRVNSTKTPEEVLDLVDEIYGMVMEEEKKKKTEKPKKKTEKPKKKPGGDVGEVPEDGDSGLSDNAESEMPSDQEMEDELERNSSYNEFEKNLSDKSDTSSIYNNYETGEKYNHYKNVIIPYGKIIEDSKTIKLSVDQMKIITTLEERFDQYLDSTKTSVSVMVKEFEMRRSADDYKRRRNYSSGELNTSKLFKYRISDNIFKTKTLVQDGENHGLILLLDWSGSMGEVLRDCIDQIINITLFCSRVKIPFRVYAFTSHSISDRQALPENSSTKLSSGIHLLELFSSEMSKPEMKEMGMILWSGRLLYDKVGYGLSRTPLNSSLIYVNDIILTFRKSYGVQKTSLVILTDGDDTDGISIKDRDYNPIDGIKPTVNTIRDSVTSLVYTMSGDSYDITNNLLRMIRDRNKSSIIVFYIAKDFGIVESKAARLGLKKVRGLKYLHEYKSDIIDKYFFVNSLSIKDSSEMEFSDKMIYNKEIRIMLSQLIKEFA